MAADPQESEAYRRFSATVDGPLTIISLAWLPILIIPLVVRLHGSVASSFAAVDYVVWAMFLLEYIVKFSLAADKRRFFRAHLLDLIIVAIPFFRPARAFRVLRLLRAGSVLGRGMGRLKTLLSHHGLHYVLLSATVLIFVGAGAELSFEVNAPGSNIRNYGQSLWWAMVTVTTVGYGDKYPVSPGGRGVAVVLMLVGIALLGVVTATIASYFVEAKTDYVRDELVALRSELQEIKALLSSNGQRIEAISMDSAEYPITGSTGTLGDAS